MARFYDRAELNERKLFIISFPLVGVMDCSFVLFHHPMDILTSTYADKQLVVGSEGLAVNVHNAFHCFSSVVESFAEAKENLDGWILVER